VATKVISLNANVGSNFFQDREYFLYVIQVYAYNPEADSLNERPSPL
jgi:hypothetical protein